ncbi:MAG: hypothetical protein WBY12_11215 [Hyphomicrobium sp.]|jgi:hypothetical protein
MMRTSLTSRTFTTSAASLLRDALIPSATRRKTSVVAKPLPDRRSPMEQWSRVIGVLTDAQSRAHRALDSHKGASAQLDAATYALQRLREEIAPALVFTGVRAVPPPVTPTAFRREQFRRREPIAA